MSNTTTPKPFAVNLWCSHPDEKNDDCQSGDEFDTLEEAEKAYAAPVTDPHAAFVELTGPDSYRRVRRNPAYDAKAVARKRARDDAEWRNERAMQAGMALGVEAYNEEMGYD
jgi:hypothetical protein